MKESSYLGDKVKVGRAHDVDSRNKIETPPFEPPTTNIRCKACTNIFWVCTTSKHPIEAIALTLRCPNCGAGANV